MRSLGLKAATDFAIFQQAKKENAVIMSKDQDFVKLIDIHGIPPQLIWITCGNTSNAQMCEILESTLGKAVSLLNKKEPIVEISNRLTK